MKKTLQIKNQIHTLTITFFKKNITLEILHDTKMTRNSLELQEEETKRWICVNTIFLEKQETQITIRTRAFSKLVEIMIIQCKEKIYDLPAMFTFFQEEHTSILHT